MPKRYTALLHRLPSLGAALLLATAGTAVAQTPEERGRAVFEEMDRRDTGFGDSAATMTMILANRQGGESRRKLAIETLEGRGEAEGDKVLMVFDYPPDVRGTALLTYTKILEPDDQWLFMPAVKRVKRISSSNKAGPFLGSEFAYEDFLSQEVEKFKYRWLRDEACGDMTCFVVERVPLYEGSGYMRQIVWMDQAEYRAMRIDYFDRRDERTKTLTADDYRQHLGRFWRATRLTMENHQTGKSTVLEFDGYRFRTGLTEDRLSPERLGHLW